MDRNSFHSRTSHISQEAKRLDAYLHTVNQLEPDIHPVDRDAALTSIAISLKRIADSLVIYGEHQLNKDAGR